MRDIHSNTKNADSISWTKVWLIPGFSMRSAAINCHVPCKSIFLSRTWQVEESKYHTVRVDRRALPEHGLARSTNLQRSQSMRSPPEKEECVVNKMLLALMSR